MERIASFSVDHTKLKPGLYVSRVDGDVVTYDIRMRRPNAGSYLSNGVLRNTSYGDRIIYVGPMGCRTGFYFLTRDSISRQEAIDLLKQTFAFIASYEGEIPGAAEAECGNYREHDLAGARKAAEEMQAVLADWTPEKMEYEA